MDGKLCKAFSDCVCVGYLYWTLVFCRQVTRNLISYACACISE